MKTRSTRPTLLLAALMTVPALAFATGPRQPAQDAPQATMKPAQSQNKPMYPKRRPMRLHQKVMGRHQMPGTVTSVDHKTGIVKVRSLGMPLVVHFPPPSIKDLKTGDKISLHLGYRITGQP